MFTRYAIFYTAPPGAFGDFCASWLGWDSRTGKTMAHPKSANVDVAALTATPRKYGFHGTLKAPFQLATQESEADLQTALNHFAKTAAPVMLDGMSLEHTHGFLALRPTGPTNALHDLAARIVTDFDRFRAPATSDELARRRQAGLTTQQDYNLTTWGYPFVMDDFHFHLTLSGRIDGATARPVLDALRPVLTACVPTPFMIDHITLMGQTGDGMFHEIQRAALVG